MIKKLKSLNSTGVFHDFSFDNTLDEFTEYNLIYGWNGSGKSTLTRVLALLEKNETQTENFFKDFPDSKFSVSFEGGATVDENSLSNSAGVGIRVFNKDFIDSNIDWQGETKSKILIISEEKIQEKTLLEKAEKTLQDLKNRLDEAEGKRDLLTNSKRTGTIDSFLKDSAKKIREHFALLSPKDSYYLNYDKTRLEKKISGNLTQIKDKSLVLSDKDIDKLKKQAKPVEMNRIDVNFNELDEQNWNIFSEKLKEILEKELSQGIIDRLKDNPDIRQWVEEGKSLHEDHESNICEFCQQEVPKERWDALKIFFNEESNEVKEKLRKSEEWIDNKLFPVDALPTSTQFFEEFQEDYFKLIEGIESINLFMSTIKGWVSSKSLNPSTRIDIPEDFDLNEHITVFNSKVESINEIIKNHNTKTDNFSTIIADAQEKLELHYASELADANQYFSLLGKHEEIKKEVQEFSVKIKEARTEVNKLRNLISNEALGADEFNKLLRKFLGHSEIELSFKEDLGGYQIVRSHDGSIASNLSEGEKTAIAFIFFITKLKENGNDVSKQIVVIDDPISSFDSNSLFSAASFLRSECDKAKQLFVLTHNFNFFKLIRKWFIGKNSKKKVRTNLYTIRINQFNPKKSVLENADETLESYDSEYHYLFSKLYEFKDQSTIVLDNAFLIANLSRKLLEAFLSFKYPKKRNDFAQLLDLAFDEDDQDMKEKIYRFINHFSHLQRIDFYEGNIDIQISEFNNIAQNILDVVKRIDEQHYYEMEGVCSINLT